MRSESRAVGFAVGLTLVAGSVLAAKPPSWVSAAAATPSVTGAEATVLLEEQSVRVDKAGRWRTTQRRVVRIDSVEDVNAALDFVVFGDDTGDVADGGAWLVRPDGRVRSSLSLAGAIDYSPLGEGEIHDEIRRLAFDLTEDVQPGDLFASEWVLVDRGVFTQAEWWVQGPRAIARARFSVRLPEGWSAEGVALSGAHIAPVRSGRDVVWEARDIPALPDETHAPDWSTSLWRLGLSWHPPAGSRMTERLVSFRTWNEVAVWLDRLARERAVADEALKTEAASLSAGIDDPMAAAQAVAERVQDLRYVSIQTGVGRGGGYRPAPANEVLARGYGDCKDKSTLMRTLLAEIGVTAWPAVACVSSPDRVQAAWPSPQQFDHCIVAMAVPDGFEAPGVVQHERLGPLLFFDPTAESVPFGQLPLGEQGGQVLLVHPKERGLVRLPRSPEGRGSTSRSIDLRLAADGAASIRMVQDSSGPEANSWDSLLRSQHADDSREGIERWLARELSGARLTEARWELDEESRRFQLELELDAARHAHSMGRRLLLVPQGLLPIGWSSAPNCDERVQPFAFNSHEESETLRLEIPDGFDLDELPESVELTVGPLRLRTSATATEGGVLVERTLTRSRGELAAEDCEAFAQLAAAAADPSHGVIVLVRK